ncbi:MAG: hydantoinase/oxoprolinase family protein, partial [Pseudomonadota bacterium]|nr:hydantoinase/oxoprolinase family protein [Pseudomonadota bacterium]
DGKHERRIAEIAAEVMPNIPVSISSSVIPEMYEYERTETTVVNSYIRPVVSKYIRNLETELLRKMEGVKLHILRSDGGLSSAESAMGSPVNLLMSGPAGGVAGALWIARRAGFKNLLTFDMGGTSTDVALIENGVAQTRRETRVGHVTVRAPSIDVRTVGAGGGSIAYVPELTRALRVGPQSAGAAPGPAAYAKGGEQPTVTDANVVLGYLPENLLGGSFKLDRDASTRAVQTIADALGISLMEAAAGIVSIVNETMYGALRLVSVQQGYDPRDFALMAFGGAGPLHGNAMGLLMGSWPVIIPPSPGVLCAYGDATTRLRVDAQRSFNKLVTQTTDEEVRGVIDEVAAQVTAELAAEGVPEADQELRFEIDVRYAGQAFEVPLTVERSGTIADLTQRFDTEHKRLFTFNLGVPQELVNIRVVALGKAANVGAEKIDAGTADPSGARLRDQQVWMDGATRDAVIYDRAKLKSGNRISGPAIIVEMDSTTLVLNGHIAEVDSFANIMITPEAR